MDAHTAHTNDVVFNDELNMRQTHKIKIHTNEKESKAARFSAWLSITMKNEY